MRLVLIALILTLGWVTNLAAQDLDSADSAPVPKALPPGIEEGVASYYGDEFQGRLTSSGTRFDQKQFTAAHRTLPFGTKVLVTNRSNGLTTEVTVTDRGPFVAGRIIDLTKAAASRLGIIATGTAPVTLKVLETGPSENSPEAVVGEEPPVQLPAAEKPWKASLFLQIGAYRSLDNAHRLADDLRTKGFAPRLRQEGGIIRVFLEARDGQEARDLQDALGKNGYLKVQKRERPLAGADVD